MALAEEKLIEEVRKHVELYDTTHGNYMKSKLKNRIWAEIAKELKLEDGEEAKTSWLKLRGSYRDARRRQQRCFKSGAAPQNIKPWRLQKQMTFLEPFMSTGPREGNLNHEKEDTEEETPTDNVNNTENEDESTSEEFFSHESQESQGDEEDDGSRRFREVSPVTPVVHKAKKKKNNENVIDMISQSIKERQDRARQRAENRRVLESTSTDDDPLYNFFFSMYQSTKNMPPQFQHRVRAQLFQSVNEAEGEILNFSFNPPSFASSYHNSDQSQNTYIDLSHSSGETNCNNKYDN